MPTQQTNPPPLRSGFMQVDTDSDGTVDVLDADSDNDGKTDIIERGDGQPSLIASTTDTDFDGLLDIFESGTINDRFVVNDNNWSGGVFNLARDINLNADGQTQILCIAICSFVM